VNGLQKERDSAISKMMECKAKLSEMKESGKKEISNLQNRLAKVS